MTATPHPCATDTKKSFLASAAWGSVHLHCSGVTDPTMQAAHPEIVRFSRAAMPDDVVRHAVAKTDGGLETCSGRSLQ